MLQPWKKKEGDGHRACSAHCLFSLWTRALRQSSGIARRELDTSWQHRINSPLRDTFRPLPPCSSFSTSWTSCHPITFPLQPWRGVTLSCWWMSAGCAGDILTPLQQLGWHKNLTTSHMLNCSWPYLQDQDHIFLLIPGRSSFKRPRIGNSSPLFPCFPHIFWCGDLFTTVMQAEEEGWAESRVLAAGHSVAAAALRALPGPCIPRIAMLRRAGGARASRGRRKCPASLVRADSPLGL